MQGSEYCWCTPYFGTCIAIFLQMGSLYYNPATLPVCLFLIKLKRCQGVAYFDFQLIIYKVNKDCEYPKVSAQCMAT